MLTPPHISECHEPQNPIDDGSAEQNLKTFGPKYTVSRDLHTRSLRKLNLAKKMNKNREKTENGGPKKRAPMTQKVGQLLDPHFRPMEVDY